MNGVSMGAMPGGLLAKKGTAKPAMRRQSQIQQAGFGAGNNGLSGWLTGAEDDCGWNDMGDTPDNHAAATPAFGLTPATDSPDSLYVNSDGEDWDEAEGYDEDARAEPGWTPQPVAPSNPVGALQDRLREASASIRTEHANGGTSGAAHRRVGEHASAPAPTRISREAAAAEAGPIGLFGHIRATIAHFAALILGRGPVLVVHPGHDLRARIASAAAREGCSEAEIAEKAVTQYLDPAPKGGFTSHVVGNA